MIDRDFIRTAVIAADSAALLIFGTLAYVWEVVAQR